MAKIWRNRIIAGDKAYNKCPVTWKLSVKDLLWQDVIDGVITASQYTLFVGEEYIG